MALGRTCGVAGCRLRGVDVRGARRGVPVGRARRLLPVGRMRRLLPVGRTRRMLSVRRAREATLLLRLHRLLDLQVQVRGDRPARDRMPRELLDAAEQVVLLGRDQARRAAARRHARRPPHPMHVVLRHERDVEVHHVADRLDVQPSRRNVRRNQDAHPPRTEPLERLDPLPLRAVRVDARHPVPGPRHRPRDPIGPSPRAREHQRALLVLRQEGQQHRRLLALRDEVGLLLRPLRDRPAADDLDADRVLQARPREPGDLPRHRGREEHRLPLARDLRQDPVELRLEPHVQHPVRLVQDQDLDPPKPRRPALHVVDQAARRRDDDLDVRAKGPDLRLEPDAANDLRRAEPVGAAKERGVLDDLQRKLARGRNDEGPRAVPSRQALYDGQHERGGLAGPRGGAADDVAALQGGRDRLRLDERGGLVVRPLQGLQAGLGEAQRGKRGGRDDDIHFDLRW